MLRNGEWYGMPTPRHAGTDDWTEVEPRTKKAQSPRLVIMFPGDRIKRLSGVIVEMWNHVVPRNTRSGSKDRKYKETFTDEERKVISTWHKRMYQWELVTGHPDEVGMTLKTYELLERAANFFASI